ncbi:MAG TPA: OB-fold domain-containing protein, partial [Polyangiales bacterium]|nr:OB-fold domain-containing protein [Polyangiales bacterium]
KLSYVKASGRGKVTHFTVCHTSPYPEFDQFTPYILALIELDEGVRMMSNVLDCSSERIRVGLRVRVRFETRGPGRTGPDPKDATKPGEPNKFVSLPMFVPL